MYELNKSYKHPAVKLASLFSYSSYLFQNGRPV